MLSRTHHQASRHGDAGFTLVELLVTMAISTVVLLAILSGADLFASSAKSATNAAAAQDTARAQVRDMVAYLRQGRIASGQSAVTPGSGAGASDLTIAAYVRGTGIAAPGETAGWIRYCTVVSGTRASLIVGVRVGDAYAAPGTCSATDVTNGWQHAAVVKDLVRSPAQLFTYTTACSTCAISTVGIRLAIAAEAGSDRLAFVASDAVTFRNRSTP